MCIETQHIERGHLVLNWKKIIMGNGWRKSQNSLSNVVNFLAKLCKYHSWHSILYFSHTFARFHASFHMFFLLTFFQYNSFDIAMNGETHSVFHFIHKHTSYISYVVAVLCVCMKSYTLHILYYIVVCKKLILLCHEINCLNT